MSSSTHPVSGAWLDGDMIHLGEEQLIADVRDLRLVAGTSSKRNGRGPDDPTRGQAPTPDRPCGGKLSHPSNTALDSSRKSTA